MPEFTLDQLEQYTTSLGGGRRATWSPILQQPARLLKNPRVAETTAADRHEIGARFAQEAQSIGRLAHAAAATHGKTNALLHARHHCPVGATDIRLRNAAGMHFDGRRPFLFAPSGHLAGRLVLTVRPGPELECHRYRHGP